MANEKGKKDRTLIDSLKNYKELIAIITFFIGGFIWLDANFATKKQVRAIILNTSKQISMLESRLEARKYFDDLNKNLMRLKELSIPNRTVNQEMEFVRISTEIKMLQENYKLASTRSENISHNLKTGYHEQ